MQKLGVWILFLILSAPSIGQRVAVTRLADVDEDFAFQGEYSGLILPETGTAYQAMGLQVIARGNGRFDAVGFDGGLPGAGGAAMRQTFSGERSGQELLLVGDQRQIRIQNGTALVQSAAGETLGSFPRQLRRSPTLGAAPPFGAVVLFDGSNTDAFKNGKMTKDGLLREGTQLRETYQDFTLHVEFRLPYMPGSKSQKRANSGLYLQSRYELQILDSFGLEGAANECGAMYRYRKPDVNMCFPPLSWQTYDIDFRSPRFDDDGKKTQHARITVRHNGVIVHNDFELQRKTGAGKQEGPKLFPIKFQNHGDPVRFRNIWLVDRTANQQERASAGFDTRSALLPVGSPAICLPTPPACFCPCCCCRQRHPVRCRR